MTILNDRQITQRCVPPTHKLDAEKYGRLLAQPQVSTLLRHSNFFDQMRENEEKERQRKESCMVPLSPEEKAAFEPMIAPFEPRSMRQAMGSITKPMGHPPSMVTIPTNPFPIISLGLSSFGYDVSLADEFKLFTNLNSSIIDPKKLDDGCLVDAEVKCDETGARYVLLPPNSYLLGRTVEYFKIPRDVLAICVGKSTYARAGAIVNVTPIEPGFHGHVVIEIANSTTLPMKIYAFEGISQFMFFQGEPCEVSYADRDGKYQFQEGIRLPTV